MKRVADSSHFSETELSKKRKGTVPIHRHSFKGRYLHKHASLLNKRDSARGVLISCLPGFETNAIGQATHTLELFMSSLFPDSLPVWPVLLEESDKNLNLKSGIIPNEPNLEHLIKDSVIPKDVVVKDKHDRKFQMVDTGCSGLIFISFKNNVAPNLFVESVFCTFRTVNRVID